MAEECEVLRRLMVDELKTISLYEELKVYLNLEERKALAEIIEDEYVHFEQLRCFLKKRKTEYCDYEKKAIEENNNV